MEKTIIDVPKMYADHHVEVVRDALLQIDGIEEVYASSSFRRVAVAYNPARLDAGSIEKALAEAGYTPGENWQLAEVPEGKEDNSPWYQSIQRVTTTCAADLEMSGDHRRY